MIRILIGGVVAGAVFFFWGFLVHMVIQLHANSIRAVPDEPAFGAVLDAHLPETGAYFFPAFPEHEEGATDEEREAARQAFVDKHEAGPIALIFFRKEGMAAMHPMHFIGGAAIFILVGLVASVLVSVATPGLGFVGRWMFVFGIGAITVLFGEVSMWNWWHLPTDYMATMVLDHLIGWALAGAAIAMIVRPLPGQSINSA